jgi:hypothetical protein
MLSLNNLIGFWQAPRAPIDKIYVGTSSSSSGQASAYTFSSVNLGAARSGRIVVLAITVKDTNSPYISSVTVNGVAATPAVVIRNSNGQTSAIYFIENSASTSGTIVINVPDSASNCSVTVYNIHNATSSVPITGSSTGNPPAAVNLSLPAAAVAVGVSATNNRLTATWSGLTKDINTAIGSSNDDYSTASGYLAVGSNSLSVNYQSNVSVAFAAWR